MSKYKRLGKNTLFVFIGNFGSKIIALLMLPFYTKWLSVEEYGFSDVIIVYATFFLGIVTLSISESVFIFPKNKKKSIQTSYFSSGIFFTLLCFVITALLFFIVKNVFLYNNISNSFTEYTWFIFFVIVSMFLQKYLQQFTRSIDKMGVFATSGIVLTALIAGLSFMLIPLFGVYGFLYAQIGANIFTSLFTFIASKSYSYLSFKKINKELYKEMVIYSIPLIPNAIMWWFVSSINRPLMELYLGVYAIGLFAVANKFPSILYTVYNVFGNSWQISVLEEYDKKGFSDFYNKMLQIIYAVLLLSAFCISLTGEWIVELFTDEKYLEAWRLIPILSLSIIFSSISSFVGTNFSAHKKSKYFFYSSIWGAIASIALNMILIPMFGLIGVALAVVLSHFVMALTRLIYSWKFVKVVNLKKYIFLMIYLIFIISVVLIEMNQYLKFSFYMSFILALIYSNRNLKDEFIKGFNLLKKKI